jgi:hypothetical protein
MFECISVCLYYWVVVCLYVCIIVCICLRKFCMSVFLYWCITAYCIAELLKNIINVFHYCLLYDCVSVSLYLYFCISAFLHVCMFACLHYCFLHVCMYVALCFVMYLFRSCVFRCVDYVVLMISDDRL